MRKPSLARYVGWGAMPDVLSTDYAAGRVEKHCAETCKELLVADEYESARASTPNAHFTSPLVIEAIWDGLQRLGLRQRRADSGAGHGRRAFLRPDAGDRCRAATGPAWNLIPSPPGIAKKLYPDSTIFAKGFEETPLPDNYFDAVVGNVPFGDYAVHDPAMKRQLTRAIHDYFFAKSLEKAAARRRHGAHHQPLHHGQAGRHHPPASGRAARTCSARYACPTPRSRAMPERKSPPTFSFCASARPEQQPAGQPGASLRPSTARTARSRVNEYFARHPEMMLGKMKLEGTMYRGAEPTLDGELTPGAAGTRGRSACPKARTSRGTKARGPPPPVTRRRGVHRHQGRRLCRARRRSSSSATATASSPPAFRPSAAARIRGMMAVRDAVRLVFRTQLDDAPEERNHRGATDSSTSIYDSFVRRYGPLSSRENHPGLCRRSRPAPPPLA